MKKITRMVVLLSSINFLAGAAIMVMEMTGIRLLAPTFGSSIFSWTSLIGVVLIALSLGGIVGGVFADKSEKSNTLVHILLSSALFSVATPVLYLLFKSPTQGLGLISGPVIFSILLFLIPAFLLGMVGPFVTRLISGIHKDQLVGFSSGITNMTGALGSFLGTFLAGFYLIPEFDTRSIFFVTGCFLLACGVLAHFGAHSKTTIRVFCAYFVGFVALSTATYGLQANKSPLIVSVDESPYQTVTVALGVDPSDDTRVYTSLFNDRQLQGSMYDDTGGSPHQYPRYWELAKQYRQDIKKGLVLGGGAYTIPKMIEDDFPNSSVTVVELDPVVIEAANKYFRLSEYSNITTVKDDARRFLNDSTGNYDFAFIDVFNGLISIPSHLVTIEFFQELKASLSSSGVVMMNLVGSANSDENDVSHAIHNTVKSVFNNVHVYTTVPENSNASSLTNVIIFASDQLIDPNGVEFKDDSELNHLINTYRPEFSNHDSVGNLVLTDFRNPIDKLFSELLMKSL